MSTPEPRLTSLAHGGGCGCKLAPAVLRDILKGMPLAGPFADLMVGTETSDDAAVWRLNDQQALVATTDFFMPVVDDPFDFGRIAATNALSDVYAMGATPIFALALVAGLALAATAALPALRALDAVATHVLLVAGMHHVADAARAMVEHRLGQVLLRDAHLFAALEVADTAAVDRAAHCFLDLVFVAPHEALAVADGLVLAG